jgi:hypothetical protein
MKNVWGRGARTSLLSVCVKDAAARWPAGMARVAPFDRFLQRGLSVAIILAVFFSCLVLTGVALAQPPNDNFTNAFVISGSAGTTNSSNINATLQPGETNKVLINDAYDYNNYYETLVPVTNSVWFQWTATNNGYVTFDTAGSVDESNNPMATVVAAWTGNNVSNLTLVAGDADIEDDIFSDFATYNPNSVITFYAQSNVTYSISVDVNLAATNYLNEEGLPGNYVLNWDAMQPANDIFTNAAEINGSFGSVSGSNFNATDQPGAPTQVTITDVNDVNYYSQTIDVSNSVWFQWTAPQSCIATFNTIGSTDLISNPMDTVLAVWTGNSVTNLTLVASDDDTYDDVFGQGIYFDDPNSTVTLPVTAGTNYYISQLERH